MQHATRGHSLKGHEPEGHIAAQRSQPQGPHSLKVHTLPLEAKQASGAASRSNGAMRRTPIAAAPVEFPRFWLGCSETRAFPMCVDTNRGETLVKSCQMSDSVWHRQASTEHLPRRSRDT